MTQKETDFENLPPTIQPGAAALDDAWREKIPLVLGNYERVEELGGGGFGVVFKVRHTGLHWERAMKVLDPRIAQEPGERERFLREARVLAGLRNVPEVVRIDDISPPDSAWNWLVMELVPGRRLTDCYTAISAAHWLAWHLQHEGDERGLPEAEVLRIFRDVLAALTAAHEMGIVHRDIKPGNILLLPEGGAKLSDFGLVKLLEGKVKQQEQGGKSSHLLNLPQSRNYMGTAQYMSPEQEHGKPLDGRSDIYSLGLVIYELLVGHPLGRRMKMPHEMGLGLAKFWDELLDRMMETRPGARPGSAADVGKMLPGSVDEAAEAERQKVAARQAEAERDEAERKQAEELASARAEAEAAKRAADEAIRRATAQAEVVRRTQEKVARDAESARAAEQLRLRNEAILQSKREAKERESASRRAQHAAAEFTRAAMEQAQRENAEREKNIQQCKANANRNSDRQTSTSPAYSTDEITGQERPLLRWALLIAGLSLMMAFLDSVIGGSIGGPEVAILILMIGLHSVPILLSARMYGKSLKWGISSLLGSFFLALLNF